MVDSRFTNANKVLKDYNFDSENAISSDVLCTICNRILIDAHYSPCGCRFCLKCITAYLDGEAKSCPGNTGYCNIDLLNMNNNVHIDQATNIKVLRLMAKCPERQCHEKAKLRKLEENTRVCDWRQSNSALFNVGCRNVQMAKEKMEQHGLSENYEHTSLLTDRLDILMNDVEQMKEEMKKMKEEVRQTNELKADMRELREVVNGKQIVIDELRAVIAQQSLEIETLGKEIVTLGITNRQIKDQINGLGTKEESDEVADLEMTSSKGTQIAEMTTQINEKLEPIELKGSNIDVKIGGLGETVIATTAQQAQLNYGEFVWPINNFSVKRRRAQFGRKTEIFSPAFLSHENGYKMCLSVMPSGIIDGTHLSVFIHLMRGPFDHMLPWPCKFDVTIAIINQQTRLDHFSRTAKYDSPDWEKEKGKYIIVDGYLRFIKFDELLSDIALCANDRICIKCTVQIS